MNEDSNFFPEEKKQMNLPIFHANDMLPLQLNSASQGHQRKWFTGDYYVKESLISQGKIWKDHLVEIISGEIGKLFSEYAEVVTQFECIIDDNGKQFSGCYSKNFCRDDETFISFEKLCSTNKIFFEYDWDYKDRFENFLTILKSTTGLDCTEYFYTMVLIDYLVGNEDRNLNNFGVIKSGSGFRIAPLFDFGLGLFEHDCRYEQKPFNECLKMMQSKPFSTDNQEITDYVLARGAKHMLPKEINLSNCQIPSGRAEEYLRNRCEHLGIELVVTN